MFRIRRIYDDILPINREAIGQVQEILQSHFGSLRPEEADQLTERLRHAFKQRFRAILYVAENRRRVAGFALLTHEPELHFCYLDFIAAEKGLTGRGVGGALYHRVRQEARILRAKGLFFECLPDDPQVCRDAGAQKQNASRMRFYERYGVLPVVGTRYEAPITPGDADPMPHLMFDGLDWGKPLRREFARRVVRAVLERKYADLCPPDYVEMVVDSYRDDPVLLRPPQYAQRDMPTLAGSPPCDDPIAMVINQEHNIHHVRERGYVEAPVRISALLKDLEPTGLFEKVPAGQYAEKHIKAVHDGEFLAYLRRACENVGDGKSVYPYVFPIRNAARPPKELSVRAGYYCIDTFTPLNGNAFRAARRAVDCTLTAADCLLSGKRVAYSLVRPPGHHAERRVFGGFCYLNNNAIAANYLSRLGKVAIVDIDYHHGNGQQDIFYQRSDVLTVSIHGHPNFAYPYFSGFAEERGEGPGEGANMNLPLPESVDGPAYRKALQKALRRVADFGPDFLVVALGLDTARGDPTGTWQLEGKDFEQNGRMLGELGVSTLVVQEGGYRTRTLGANARYFFRGLAAGAEL